MESGQAWHKEKIHLNNKIKDAELKIENTELLLQNSEGRQQLFHYYQQQHQNRRKLIDLLEENDLKNKAAELRVRYKDILKEFSLTEVRKMEQPQR
ncbi:hypothetical protein HOM50_03575 [bacterium]|jgi:hypothetical protein|nr:hypothetical protein [bacterium]MBT5015458.1 hypothetical protein [bacterium]